MTEPPVLDAAPADEPAGRAAGRRWGTAALAAAIVVGLLLGFAAGWLAPRLTRPGDDSAEAGFARDMTSHHAQAVEMGLLAFRSATNPGVRQIGVDIATSQQGEIGTMQDWLATWGLEPTGSQPPMAWVPDGTDMVKNGLMPGMATPAEMERLRSAQGVELDRLFIQMMIKHHIGGIHMIDAVLDQSDDPAVHRVAETMKRTQQTALTNMRTLQQQVGG
ncbi:MAG TPA: DUF305 domain-containing protein [Micromonospora sp.]